MQLITIIDDKEYAYKQIANALNELSVSNNYEVVWYKSFKEYQKTNNQSLIIFLDYHLDNDLTYGSKIISQLQAKYLIGYSSTQKGSDRIKQKGVESGLFKGVFSVLKEKGETPSPQLIKVLKMIASEKE